ncbi:MAG: hypothetical protein JO340_02220 [Acidobacteriaceae bacterium]|nr:hypothetical protein [Acidobacteriaceae bacterium]
MGEPQPLEFDNPVGMLDDEDDATLARIDEGMAEIEAGQADALDELRREIAVRCSR